MAVGRKPPPWRRGNTGPRRPRGGRGLQHSGNARQLLFAASPLLLLLIGYLPSLTLGVAAMEARAEAEAGGDRDGPGGGRFGWFRSSNQPSEGDYEVAPQQQQRRKLEVGVPSNVVLSESTVSVAEGGADATYTISLDSDPGTTVVVTVDISTASSDILLSASQLTFDDSNYGDAQSVTVSAVEDGDVESLEEATITHSVSVSSGYTWNGAVSPGSDLTARVYDNDEAGIVVSPSTLYVDEGGSAGYEVKLMGMPSQDVVVTAAASNGYVTVTASRTFTSLTWDDTQTFTVSGTDDAVETAESYTATISHTASSSDPLFDGAAPLFFPSSELPVVIYDNDDGCYRSCDPGEWASPCVDSYECSSCSPGYSCAGDCNDPVACPAGTSLSAYGSSDPNDCEACPSGYYSSEEGSAACSQCEAGYYCSSAAAAPVACPAGEFAGAGALTCSECADGYYNALEAQGSCQECPAGYSCANKALAPTQCSSGSYSEDGATVCTSCPAGSYCSSTGSSPVVCADGSYSLENWAYCVACPAGAYCINTDQEPTECLAGTSSLGGSTTCTACASGTYSSVDGSIECTNCPAGMSCTDVSAEPVACPSGTFSMLGAATCSDCDAGLYSDEGASSCLACPAGYSCLDPANSPPTLCDEGFTSNAGLACIACSVGTYTDSSRDHCIACTAGYECSDPTLGPVLCDEGFYSTGNAITCTECPAGSFCTSPFTVAEACGAGTYSTAGSPNCTVCPGGSSCATPSDLPIACSDGYYSAEGATTCTVCPAGSYCPGPPRDEASKAFCPPGMYSESGASSCSPCPKGHFCPDATLAPVACPNGYYAYVGNMTACDECPAGSFCPSAEMPPQDCPGGYYSEGVTVSCTACPAGAACPTTATGYISCSPGTFSVGLATNCTSCPPGYYCPNTEAAEYYDCPDGTYSTGDASTCEICPPGYYCPLKTVAAELPCPDGTYSTGGASNCTACDGGFTCTADGTGLVACEAGYYSQAGAAECVACPAGSYCPHTANATVFPCPEGSYSLGHSQSCTPCEAGYYCPFQDSDQSLPCLSGTFAIGGKHVCTDCPAGFTCSSIFTDQMETCGPGYYSLLGAPLCEACPAGSRCPLAKDSPIACDPGYYSTAASTNCTSCPAGYFCDDPEALPQPCEVGFYSGGGTAVCEACQPGYRCPEASVGATPAGSECPEGTYCNPARTLLECPAGTYGNVTAAASLEEGCQACTEGYYCTDTGNTLATRKVCPAGNYCPVGSSSPSACAAGLYSSSTGAWSSNVCQECDAGYYCTSGSDSATSKPCPAGYYCPVNTPSSTSYPCPEGTYSGATGNTLSSQCSTCPIGTYCLAGSTNPTNCLPGTYQPSEGATSPSACQQCEPGWACESAGMFVMTTLCDPGHYCPKGTSYADQYPCPAGYYTDETNLTSAIQCSDCPERKACFSGSTSNDWSPCGEGHFCPENTPTRTSYPCSAGSFTNRTDLAADSECYPCPLGEWCGGSGTPEPDGPCEAGYYCPLRTAAATDYPCPAGTFSSSTSLYHEAQCEDCPPGYYCPEASMQIEPCPAGTYSPYNATEDAGPDSFPSCTICPAGSYCVEASVNPVACGVGMYSSSGADACSVCEAGFYCGSNETSAVDLFTGDGSWDLSSNTSGMCFNGTYCAAGMTRAPDLYRDACPAGHYCPAGVTSPYPCPSGTYNPHTGRDDLEEDCLISLEGYYTIEASTNMTGSCDPGYYCPPGSTGPQQVPCPERFYRSSSGAGSQDDCAYCVSGGYCPSGSTEPIDCPRGFYCVHGVAEPEPCPLGTYGNTTGLRKITDCRDCDPGSYCDQRGLTYPAGLCDPGYYCLDGSYTSAPNAPGSPLSIEDTDIGGLCPAGGYCPIGSSYQQPCPHGTFNNFSGAADPADCSDCPPGFYCSGTSNPAPTGGCYAGHYCTGGASTPTQNRTDRGYYAPVGAAVQYPCEPGTYNNEESQESCLDCPAGYYCPDQATITETVCPVGSYCPAGSDYPTLCPSGTYSNELAVQLESGCTSCTQGKYCAYNGLTEPTGDCAAGYYCSGGAILSNPVDQVYGDECYSGHYCEEGSPWPVPCPFGTYFGAQGNDGEHWANNTVTGAPYRTYCTLCPAGRTCNSTGLTSPDLLCAEGYFCKLGASDPLPYCEAGEGLCTYGVCPAGHYCPMGTSDPIVCPPGTYMNNTGAAECFDCPERYYCDGSIPRGFEECPIGQYCETGTDVPTNCPAGTYGAQAGLGFESECTACTPGSFCAETGLTAVEGPCAAGYYCPAGSEDSLGKIGGTTSHVCPEGYYCPAGVSSPVACIVGTYNPSTQKEAVEDCTDCSEGFYCETTGLVEPTGPCHSGHYCKRKVDTAAPTTGITIDSGVEQGGDLCPVGTYCGNGTATPLPCLAGTYNDLEGQEECFACPAGYYCEANAIAYDSTPCPAGYYCPEGTTFATEHACPPGTYANTTMTSSEENCVDAPAGWYVAGSASQDVSGRCDEGFYCSGGSSSATPSCVETVEGVCDTGGPCVAGQYCPMGSPFWRACPGGSYCNDASGVITGDCYAGYYCAQGAKTPSPENEVDEDGNMVGDVCPAGYYCPVGSETPLACPSGTYSGSTGNTNSTACLPCTPGFICPNASTSVPTEPCPARFYCPAGTAEATLQCGVGEACLESSGEPVACAPGTYQNEPGQELCLPCPEGHFCVEGTETPTDCPLGSYCPAGTMWGTQYRCPKGTFGETTNLVNATMCSTCTPGWYCAVEGLDAPTGQCDATYYCGGGAVIATPDSMSADGYQGDTCVDRSNGTTNDICPPGHYCPGGSGAPIPCPAGTSSSSFGLSMEEQCPDCQPGFYCPDVGTYNATVECTEGFYCPGRDASPTRICPAGHYCPAGSSRPRDCVAGTYQNDTSAANCDICPDRHYCLATATEVLPCPPGYYCPEGTEFATEYPCPNGTFSNVASLASASECTLCSPGRYCGSEGLNETEGLCGAGYYCGLGATSPVPADETDPSVGGLCSAGYACVEGAESAQPVDGVTGYACPRGTYCPAGSSFPYGCAPGTYNPSEAMEACVDCLPGKICPGNTTTPEECPEYHYCPASSATGIICPTGTYGERNDLVAESECSPCPPGYYCLDGSVTSTCRAGYFCKTGIGSPTPNSEYANITYEAYNEVWEALDAGPCPAGHYCPPGTEDPVQCANASVRASLLGVSADDCGICQAGFVCYPGEPIPEQCFRGYYCPQGEDPIPCPIGTYNPLMEQDDQDDCISCPAGSYCFSEGIGDHLQYPCPAGSFCLMRETDPEQCPPGTYRNTTGAASVEDCPPCPGGFKCHEGSVTPDACPETTYCPTGSSNTTTCPAGSYCPVETPEPIVCPRGYYCPLGSSEPVACVLGTYCPEGSEIFTSCPLGWYGSLTSNNTLWSRDEACAECEPGTYGADPDRLVCDICPGGYVCLGTTITATPTSAEEDGGFQCTVGHYCPEGSWEEIPCAAGSYNPEVGSSAASECFVCPADHYQDQEGSAACLPCSSSSTSEANATECKCLGLNRAFQLSDGQCICRSGYEYYNEGGVLVSTVDGAIDCQPIVYERCYTGEALDADGICVSESDCDSQCGDAGGTFYEHIGLCECHGQQDLNAVCDVNCRDNAALMFVDPLTGLIVVIDGNSTEYVDPANLPSFAGALYCSDDAGCGLFPVTVSTNFSGVYGTGNAVATATSVASAAADAPSPSPSAASSRRHRSLMTAAEQGESKDASVADPVEADDQVVRVRKDGGDVYSSEQDMVYMFLRRRAGNYRPRNQYRDRFFTENGTHTTIPGAIPKSQRAYTTSPLSSSSRADSYPYPSQEEEGSYGEQQEKHGIDDFDDGGPPYDGGQPPWEHKSWSVGAQEEDQVDRERAARRTERRRLVGDEAEPAVESPLSCVRKGDSVLFDISSGCYPVYDKDSLLNSNLEFDYGEFRTVAELATSSATYDTFGFVFENAGTYVFSSSCNPGSVIVLAVMGEDVSCTTDAHFVPLTAANLIKLGVAKNSDNITLTPDWALICGLLAGVAFMIFGVVSAVYYFRTKAWTTGQAATPGYRAKAQGRHFEVNDDASTQKAGFFAKRQNQVSPLDPASAPGGRGRTLRSRLSISSRTGFGSGRVPDIEMQSDSGDAFDGQDNPDVRELVERMQKYHDDVEKEFTGQKDLVMKLHHLLQQEADELKRLLGAKAGVVGDQPAAAVEKSTRATLARLKTDLASRRLHEAGVSTSEVEALSALKRLQELLQEGAEPFAKRVMQEISNADIAEKGSSHDDAHAATPLLREIQEGAELIRVEVVNELGESLERERQREHAARAVLEGAVSRGGVVLPEDIVRTLKTVSEMDAKTDAGERGVAATLKRLADRLPACTQELCASEGLILRNLVRIRAMGNTSLETAERQRGESVISKVLDQLIQALAIVGARAETEKAAVDTARIDAEVERRHLEAAVDESIKTMTIAGSADGVPPTSDDLQGMLKEIRTLVSSSGSASAASAAVVAPTRRASALFSQVAENEYRRHSLMPGDAVDTSLLAEEEAEEEARRSEIEANLLAEQEAGVAAVSAVADSQKRSLQEQLDHAGASVEEKQAMMNALTEDQKTIEGILEGERVRMEESFKSAAAARKARDEKHAEEDAVEESQTKAELLHKQNAQIKELRRKHEAAQLAVAGAASAAGDDADQDPQGQEKADGSGDETDGDDERGMIAALRKAHAEQVAMLESSLTAKAKSAKHALRERLAAQRAKREAELVEDGASSSEAAIKADKELAAKEESQQEELAATLASEKSHALKTELSTQRQVRDEARAVVKDNQDPTAGQAAAAEEAHRIREQAVEAIQALEDAMAEEGRVRRKALNERLKAKRRAKEAELGRHGAGEMERCKQDADLTRLEELQTEALEEELLHERENGLKDARASAAAAEVAATVASSRAAEGGEVDSRAAVLASKMKELHLAAMEQLENDMSRNEKNASRALRERLQAARAAREATLQDKESLSASEAAKRARTELEDGEEKAIEELMEDLRNDRVEAIGRANLEAEAAGADSLREEADRLLAEHRNRTAQLQEAMKVDAQRQKTNLQKRLAARRKGTDAVVAAAQPVSLQAAAKAATLADSAEEAERINLERSLLDEANRLQSDAEGYERSVQNILTSAEQAAASGALSRGGGASPRAAEAEMAQEEKKESLRAVHERAIAAMEAQNENKRRAAAARLGQRRAAARAGRVEAMRAAGKSEEEIAKDLAEVDAHDSAEAAQEDAILKEEGVAEIEEERSTQIAAVADGIDPKKEAARIRERHIRDAAALEKELKQHCRDQRAALASRLRKRKAAKEESLRRAGAGEEETVAAIQTLEFEAERDVAQLEEALSALKDTEATSQKQAAALASGEDEHPQSGLAELRARHQESENFLKDSLRAEAGARRARMRQRIAARTAERVKELTAQRRSKDEINAEVAAIRTAGEAEENRLEAVLATEAEARIHAARETALAAETSLEATQEEARDLRKNHENAMIALAAEMAEKQRQGKEGVAARLQEKKANRLAELKKAKAKNDEVQNELARLEQEAEREQKRVEADIEQEAAMLVQAEAKTLAKREAEARASRLTAESSRRAGELELHKIRQAHEENQRILEEAQENKRKLRQRALAERLERRRQEKMNAAIAAFQSAEAQEKLAASLEQERVAARAELEEELMKEACQELEVHTQRQARAEHAVRMSAKNAIDEAEMRAKLAREEHEESTKELDMQLAAARITQGKKLKDRLAKKRKEREKQLVRESADDETVKEARRVMEEEEQREIARLENHLARERERLHEENLARAKARRTREEAEERDRAIAAAQAADLAKQEAVGCLQRLQKQHAEQHAALEHQMEEEKRSREAKLRDRLAKKRKAKEEEMKQAALSEREKQIQQKNLEDEERAERQRFHDQLEEEVKKNADAQRRHQEEALAAAMAEAARATELAAAAAARAAATDAVREAVEAAEQEDFKRKAQKLKELSQANEEKEKAALAGSSATSKSRLMDRLAKKKAKAEAKKRELEAAQKVEEERLLAKHKEEVEAARAAAAPGWTGDIAWDEAVMVAMAEEPRAGETQSDREARVLKSVLEAGIVPEKKLGKCVELVMAGRHDKETAELLTTQYKERASRLATSLGELLVEKNTARAEALQRLTKMNATDEERADAAADVDDDFAGRQQQMETSIIQQMEPPHLEQQLELRQRQLQEIAGTFRAIAPESALERLQEINAARHEEELENFHAAMEREKEERLKRLQEERSKFEEQLRERHDAEMQRLQAEEEKVMDVEREAQETRLKAKQAELERQREEEKRKMEERSDQLNANQKEALLEKFKLDQAAELGALKAEEQSSKSKLEQKLAARRQKKTEEMRRREERQLKEKEAKDAQRLQEIERQTQLEDAAEVGALSASGSVSALKVDIDQAAIQLARKRGGPNEAKERLKETLAANETRKMVQRHNSISGRGSLSGAGGGASAAAAAAAATAATATAYTHISSKLEGIEGLISALKAAQGNRLLGPGISAGGGGSTQVYRDAEDEATIPEGNDLQIIPRDKLPVQALARLEFGEHLLSVLGLADTVKLKVAKNLPPTDVPSQGSGRLNANAFRNSYLWEASTGVLNLHVRRLSSSGDFGLVLVHAAAHIHVDPSDMTNDLDPRFTQHFHRSLKVLTQELFKYRESAAPMADGGLGSPSPRLAGSVPGRSEKSDMALGAGGAKSKKTGAGSGEFAQDLLAERMEKYARASGHPRLVELLSRHANEQKDKFTLSDDEDQVSNVGDVEYMENFDNRDADSIFRSPVASINGNENFDDGASDNGKEEKKGQ